MTPLQMFFSMLMNDLQDPYLSKDALEKIFVYLLDDDRRDVLKDDVIDPIKYWKNVLDELTNINTRNEMKEFTIKYICRKADENIMSKYNLVQGVMKAVVHQAWFRLYEIETNVRTNARDAIHDAMKDKLYRSQELFCELIDEIAKEKGYEDGDEMIDDYADC
jgi:hypothetical protein